MTKHRQMKPLRKNPTKDIERNDSSPPLNSSKATTFSSSSVSDAKKNYSFLTILDLPIPIYYQIRDYLFLYIPFKKMAELIDSSNYDSFHYHHGKKSWVCFLNLCHQSYWIESVKKPLFFLTLNRFSSFQYLYNEKFRDQCLQMIVNPRHQLCLCLDQMELQFLTKEEGKILSNLFSLDLSHNPIDTLPMMENIYDLDLDECRKLNDISKLKNISSIFLFNCKEIPSIDNIVKTAMSIDIMDCTNIQAIAASKVGKALVEINIDVFPEWKELISSLSMQLLSLQIQGNFIPPTHLRQNANTTTNNNHHHSIDGAFILDIPLPNLRRLSTTRMKILDLQYYPHLQELSLTQSLIEKGLTTLTHLEKFCSAGSVYQEIINFHFSIVLKEFNFLGIDEISLEHLNFQSLKYLTIQSPYNFHFPHLLPTGNFQSLISLKIIDCTARLEDLSPLGKIRFLVLDHCTAIQSLKGLGFKNQEIEILTNYHAYDVSMLQNCDKVKISDFTQLTKITKLAKVPYLTIRNCHDITDFSSFGDLLTTKFPNRMQSLNLTGCFTLQTNDLYFFKDIPWLTISYCPFISDISMLQNQRLSAVYCLGLHVISIHGKEWRKIDLSYCMNLRLIKVYGKIHALSINHIHYTPSIIPMEEGRIISLVDAFYGTLEGHLFEQERGDVQELGPEVEQLVPIEPPAAFGFNEEDSEFGSDEAEEEDDSEESANEFEQGLEGNHEEDDESEDEDD